MENNTKRICALYLIALIFLSATLIPSRVRAQTEVTVTEHVRLGFTTTYTFSESISDDWAEGAIEYHFSINGEATIFVDMGVDITLTYDTADILPGQPMQLQVTYTPTNDPGPEVSLDGSATLTASVDVAWWAYIPAAAFPPLLAVLATLDSIDAELDDFDLAVGSADFTAPLNGEPAVVVPGASDTAVLSFLSLDLVGASLSSSLTLSPVPLADFPDISIGGGAGGAVAFLSVSGATLTDPSPIFGVPGLPGILEWGTSGESITATIQLPSSISGSGTVDLVMSPLLHWLGTSANLDLNLDLRGVFDDIFGDRTVNIFSGSLGPIYQQVGLDTTIGDAVASTNPFNLDPGAATLVGNGFIPVPLLDPEIDEISLGATPTLGDVTFTIDLDSDDDGLMDGTEIALGLDPLDSDTDDDGLTDGDEINTYGTDPLDPDTDDDGLTDGDEVNVYGTDPLDPDSDDDGLIDGIEILAGTDPLDSDTDDDGLLDGYDVEFIQNVVNGLPSSVFKSEGDDGHRDAINSILDEVEILLLNGQNEDAIKLLKNLRKHVDGDPNADKNDWILDNAAREQVRDLIDILLNNLSP